MTVEDELHVVRGSTSGSERSLTPQGVVVHSDRSPPGATPVRVHKNRPSLQVAFTAVRCSVAPFLPLQLPAPPSDELVTTPAGRAQPMGGGVSHLG